MTIRDDQGMLVGDTGSTIETATATLFPDQWVENRSDDKGPEPEALDLALMAPIPSQGLDRDWGYVARFQHHRPLSRQPGTGSLHPGAAGTGIGTGIAAAQNAIKSLSGRRTIRRTETANKKPALRAPVFYCLEAVDPGDKLATNPTGYCQPTTANSVAATPTRTSPSTSKRTRLTLGGLLSSYAALLTSILLLPERKNPLKLYNHNVYTLYELQYGIEL